MKSKRTNVTDPGVQRALEQLAAQGQPIDARGATKLIQAQTLKDTAALRQVLDEAGDQLDSGARRALQAHLDGREAQAPSQDIGHAAPGQDALCVMIQFMGGRGHVSRRHDHHHHHGPGVDPKPGGPCVDPDPAPSRPTVQNPPLDSGPLSNKRVSTYDMSKGYHAGYPSMLGVDDPSLLQFTKGSSVWHSGFMGGNNPSKGNAHVGPLARLKGRAGVYAMLARAAEIDVPEAQQNAAAFAKNAEASGIRFGRGQVGIGTREGGQGVIGTWDVQAHVREIARLVAAGGGDASKIQMQFSPGAELTVPLAEHPHFPGLERPAFTEVPVMPTKPLGDVEVPSTAADIQFLSETGKALQFSDDALRALLKSPNPSLIKGVVRDTAGQSGWHEFMARAAEVWKAVPGIDGRKDAFRPEVEIRQWFEHTLPTRKIDADMVPGILRMAQAADVDPNMLTCRDDAGTPTRFTEHPAFRAAID